MKQHEIKLGKKYITKITTTLTVARVDMPHTSGGWVVTDMETQKQHRIKTARRFVREALPAETGDKPKAAQDKIIVCKPTPNKPAPDKPKRKNKTTKPKTATKSKSKDVQLTPELAYETWRKNNSFPGLFIFEQPKDFIAFGSDAKLIASVLRNKDKLDKQPFTFGRKIKNEFLLTLKASEIIAIMKHLSLAGNLVMLVTQKVIDGEKANGYEISKHILAGKTKIVDGLPPRDMVVKKAGQCTYRVRNNPKKEPAIQHIDIKPGSTFKVRSGNEYQIQMVAESAVYAQQMRNGKPAGPTRPFDKKSLIDGQPKGLRDEESYYPKSEALEAAEKVLLKADGPMDTKTMMLAIRKQKLWFTTARTPHTTLAAALSRDIKRNGNSSRFQRIGRGLFDLTNRPKKKTTQASKKKAVPSSRNRSGASRKTSPSQAAATGKKKTPTASKKTVRKKNK